MLAREKDMGGKAWEEKIQTHKICWGLVNSQTSQRHYKKIKLLTNIPDRPNAKILNRILANQIQKIHQKDHPS